MARKAADRNEHSHRQSQPVRHERCSPCCLVPVRRYFHFLVSGRDREAIVGPLPPAHQIVFVRAIIALPLMFMIVHYESGLGNACNAPPVHACTALVYRFWCILLLLPCAAEHAIDRRGSDLVHGSIIHYRPGRTHAWRTGGLAQMGRHIVRVCRCNGDHTTWGRYLPASRHSAGSGCLLLFDLGVARPQDGHHRIRLRNGVLHDDHILLLRRCNWCAGRQLCTSRTPGRHAEVPAVAMAHAGRHRVGDAVL